MRPSNACAVTKTYTLPLSRWDDDRAFVVTATDYMTYCDGGWDEPSGWEIEDTEIDSVEIRFGGKRMEYKGKRREAMIALAVKDGEEKEIGESTPERDPDEYRD